MHGRRRGAAIDVLVACLGSFAALGTFVAGFLVVEDLQERRDDARTEQHEIELLTARAELDLAALRAGNLVALAAALPDHATQVRAALDDLQSAYERAVPVFERLAAGDGPVAAEAAAAGEEASSIPAAIQARSVDALWFADTEGDALTPDGASSTSTVRALAALVEIQRAPDLVLSDALNVLYATSDDPTLRVGAGAFIEWSVDYLADGSLGWLGPLGSDPFDSEFLDRDAVALHLSEADADLDGVAGTPSLRTLQRWDRWARTLPDPVGEAPVELDDLETAAVVASGLVDPVVERTLTEVHAATERRADSATRLVVVIRIVAVIVISVAIGATVAATRRRRGQTRALEVLAATDPLTGVGNRLALEQRTARHLADGELRGHALLHLDLDGFKTVNDTYGHEVGDTVVRTFAERTAAAVARWAAQHPGIEHTHVRLGGDEFLVSLHGAPDASAAALEVAGALRAAMSEPVTAGLVVVPMAFSIGIAVSEAPSALGPLLLDSDLALYQAKRDGGDRTHVFDDEVTHDVVRHFVSRAPTGRVVAHLQPQRDLLTGRLVGAEALARWVGPRGVAVAGGWINAVERGGATAQLLEEMVEAVAGALAELGGADLGRVWLNVAPADVSAQGAGQHLLELLDRAGIPHERCGVEITETAALPSLATVRGNLCELRAHGLLVAVDDFGSGFTPLGHLAELPLDTIKLDRSVVQDVHCQPRRAALVESMVGICRKLGLDLVAEGIETEDELRRLRDLGVRNGQGYLLGRPMPAEQLRADAGARMPVTA